MRPIYNGLSITTVLCITVVWVVVNYAHTIILYTLKYYQYIKILLVFVPCMYYTLHRLEVIIMKTLLTRYELWCYWNCTKGYTVLVSGTLNQINQYQQQHGLLTDKDVKQQYGRSAYTVLYQG